MLISERRTIDAGEERIDLVAALARLVQSQAEELVARRADYDKLMSAAVVGLLERAARPIIRSTCKRCGQAFDKGSKTVTLCPSCYRTSTAASAAKARSARRPTLVQGAA